MFPSRKENITAACGRYRAILACGLLTALLAGCGESLPQPGAGVRAERSPAGDKQPAACLLEAGANRELLAGDEILDQREFWHLLFMQGKRVGDEQTIVTRFRRKGRELVRTESIGRMRVARGGEQSEETIRVESLETPDGKVLEFEGSTSSTRVRGRVQRGKLHLQILSAGSTRRQTIDWEPDRRGPFADQQSLRADPLEPGEQRRLKTVLFLITSFQPVTMELSARRFEPVELLSGTHRLLRVEVGMQLAGGHSVGGVLWCDRTGEILKSDMLGIVTYRASKEMVRRQQSPPQVDLIRDFSVPIARPIADAHRTRRIEYLVTLEDADPAAVFVSDESQQVEPLDEHRARIVVRALRPAEDRSTADGSESGHRAGSSAGVQSAGREAAAGVPGDEYLRPNSFIQSDDPKVVALARQAAGETDTPWTKAVALERFVHEHIESKDFSQSFASAAEVARRPAGDCTEHAVLLAALCRAVGLPSRVAVGLVYMPGEQAFGYHMWTEVFIDGRWIGLDGTLGLGGIGGAHLKLAHHSLADASAFSGFLPVMRVMGRLKIEVERVE